MPEVWINVAEKTGIEELRRTTRDEPDYDKLMRYRLSILDEHGITIDDIQQVIATMDPLPGAKEFLDEVRARWQVLILSDTSRLERSMDTGVSWVSETIASFTMFSMAVSISGCNAMQRYLLINS